MRASIPTCMMVGMSGFVAVWSVQAHAEDFNWAGAYLGGSLGALLPGGQAALNYPDGVSGTRNVYFSGDAPYFSDLETETTSPIPWPGAADFGTSAFIATVNGGYNFQNGNVVYGIEADASFFGGGKDAWSTGSVVDDDNQRTHAVSVSGGLDNLLTIRPRLGVSVDRMLLYATGGLAAGHANLATNANLVDLGYGAQDGEADWNGRRSEWKLGFIVGAGAEYALTDRLSLKLETMYYDLGSITARATGEGTWADDPLDVSSYDAALRLSGVAVRAGVNFRF